MKICPSCKIEMRLIKSKSGMIKTDIQKQTEPMYAERFTNLIFDTYVCPSCGLIQQYIIDEQIPIIEKL